MEIIQLTTAAGAGQTRSITTALLYYYRGAAAASWTNVTEVIFFPNFPSITVITWVTSINHVTIVQVSRTWANVWTQLASVLAWCDRKMKM